MHEIKIVIQSCQSGAKVNGFRLPASYFSLLVQRKVTKRKHLPREITTAQGMCRAVAIFGQAIHGLVRKRRPSMAGALRVSRWKRWRDVEGQKQSPRFTSGATTATPSS